MAIEMTVKVIRAEADEIATTIRVSMSVMCVSFQEMGVVR